MNEPGAKAQRQGEARKRICIVTPGQIGSNPRVVKEADTLHAAGYDVTVVATRMMDLVEPRDRALMQRIPWKIHRVDLGSRWAWRVRRVAQNVGLSIYRTTKWDRAAGYAFSPFVPALMGEAAKVAADLYIAHYPAALPAAAAAARQHNALLAYDAEDFHLGQSPDGPDYDEERALLRAVEGSHIRKCAFVTAASPGIASALVDAYEIQPPHVLLNVFPLDQAPVALTRCGDVEPRPSIYWFSQTIGPNRGLECAIRAIGLAKTKPHLYLRGTPTGNYEEALRALAAESDAEGRVHLLPPEVPDEMARVASRFDVGLCSEPGHTTNSRIALTNKLFTYCLAGLPPLMSDVPAQTAFAELTGLQDLVFPRNDAIALAAIVDQSLNERRLEELRGRVWKFGQERWNWEHESAILLSAVCGAIGPAMLSGKSEERDPLRSDCHVQADPAVNWR